MAKLTYSAISAPTPRHTSSRFYFRDMSPGVTMRAPTFCGARMRANRLGLDWRNKPVAMYMAGTQVSKVTFNFSNHPPTPTGPT